MLRNFVLQPDEDKRLQIEGQFLVVTQATGPVELSIGGTTPITVDEKDRIHLRSGSPNDRALRIKNVSGGINTIELHTSDLLVDKRAGVDVKNSIAIADDQRIGIDPQANIVQSIIQNPVRIDNDENTVKIEKGQCVGIDPKKNKVLAYIKNPIGIKPDENQVRADITNELTLVKGQAFGIDKDQNAVKATLTHPVELKENQTVGINPDKNQVEVKRKGKQYQALPTLQFMTPQDGVIDDPIQLLVDQNPKRESLILTADTNNLSPVWIGGIFGEGTPLLPGDRLFIDGENAITFAALTDHLVYVAEIAFKESP